MIRLDPLWAAWGEWSEFVPECVADRNDIDNPDVVPRRKRYRECKFRNGTLAAIDHESGNCPDADKIERQTDDNLCPPPFEDIKINETQIVTKVEVEFEVEIQAEWKPELTNTKSDAFKDLADIYISAFTDSLKAIDEANGTSNIEFSEVKVKRFYLIDDDSSAFRKRQLSLDQIRAEFETVYDIIAEKDESNEREIESESQEIITVDIAEKVADRVGETIEEAIEEETEKVDSGDSSEGELNFLRKLEKSEIVSKPPVVRTQPLLSDDVVLNCNCEKGETRDYYECLEDCDTLTDNKQLLVKQGSCSCAAWTKWSGDCQCDDSYQNCTQIMNRECKPLYHYNAEKGAKWDINAVLSCEGENTKKQKCRGIYDTWEAWTSCDKSCIHKGVQSIRTRHRHCNDSVHNSGKF